MLLLFNKMNHNQKNVIVTILNCFIFVSKILNFQLANFSYLQVNNFHVIPMPDEIFLTKIKQITVYYTIVLYILLYRAFGIQWGSVWCS